MRINPLHLATTQEYRLRQVINQTHDRLLSLLLSFTDNRPLCEDILQEAYIRFWNNMHKVEDDATAIYLLKRYTRNLFLDEMRKHSRREAMLVKMNPDQTTHSVEEQAISKEDYNAIQSVIDKLPEQQRLIFRMHKEQSMSYRQIAEQLGIATSTIETQMNRALKFLRRELSGIRPNDAVTVALLFDMLVDII